MNLVFALVLWLGAAIPAGSTGSIPAPDPLLAPPSFTVADTAAAPIAPPARLDLGPAAGFS